MVFFYSRYAPIPIVVNRKGRKISVLLDENPKRTVLEAERYVLFEKAIRPDTGGIKPEIA
jgi:hypothetical protein